MSKFCKVTTTKLAGEVEKSGTTQTRQVRACACGTGSHLRGLSSHDHELLGSLHQEAGELVAEDGLDLILLLDLDGHAHAVDRGLDEALLVGGTRDGHGVEQQLLAGADLHLSQAPEATTTQTHISTHTHNQPKVPDAKQPRNEVGFFRVSRVPTHLGLVVPLDGLRGEVPQAQRRVERHADAVQVRLESVGLRVANGNRRGVSERVSGQWAIATRRIECCSRFLARIAHHCAVEGWTSERRGDNEAAFVQLRGGSFGYAP